MATTWNRAQEICGYARDDARGNVTGQLLSVDTDCKEKFILSRKMDTDDDDTDEGDEDGDGDDNNSNQSDSTNPALTMAWIGLNFNTSSSRFEWQNGAKFEHDMWVSRV